MHKILRGDFISVLKIDLEKLRNNILAYKTKLKPSQKFCAVVKANAYGLGAKKICSAINDLVDYFAVSSSGEFFEIYSVVNKPILILDPIYGNITKLARKGCEFCVSNFEQLKTILCEAEKNLDLNFKIHLAFNTGMNRFGFKDEKQVVDAFEKIKKTQNVAIFGVFSHFYQGNQEIFVKNQSRQLLKLRRVLAEKFDLSKVLFHIANTSGFVFENNFDMVRIGIGMFCFNNKNIFSLETKIIEIQNLKPNETAGYGLGFVARKKTKVAVCAIGYADGIPRRASWNGFVIVGGVICKILAVCMDAIIIDISDARAKLLDSVTIIGENGGKEISCCKFALSCDTIDYEIMTGLSGRVKRVYCGEDKCKL